MSGHEDEMGEEVVLARRLGRVAHLELNRPAKRNAADQVLQRALVDALRTQSVDQEVAAIVLSGRGPAFSAGGDRSVLERIVGGEDDDLDAELREITRELLWLQLDLVRQPIVVAIHGYAIGWAAGLAAAADFVVMDEDAYLQDPHARFGLPPSPACEIVWSNVLPPAVLKDFLSLGTRMPAAEARDWGLVNDVTAPGSAVDVAIDLARKLADVPAAGLAAVKAGVNRQAVHRLRAEWPPPPVDAP